LRLGREAKPFGLSLSKPPPFFLALRKRKKALRQAQGERM
jgi:hypothetical protein